MKETKFNSTAFLSYIQKIRFLIQPLVKGFNR